MNLLLAEAGDFNPTALKLLRHFARLQAADLDRPGLLLALREVDALWVRLRHQIDLEILNAAPRLKIIVTATTGLNHIDVAEAERRGIRILSLAGEREFLKDVRATAEHAVGLMLALLRQVPAAAAHVRTGGWNRDLFKGRELYEKRVGIVGYGRLGRIVTQYLRAFGTEVLVSDPQMKVGPWEADVRFLPLMELLREADVVSLHVNLSGATKGMFGRDQFEAMRDGAYFINTARGELVDETALVEALSSGKLSGAALDVLCDERVEGMGEHPLIACQRTFPNLIITPHIGGCTVESMAKTELFLAHKLIPLLNGVPDSPAKGSDASLNNLRALCRVE